MNEANDCEASRVHTYWEIEYLAIMNPSLTQTRGEDQRHSPVAEYAQGQEWHLGKAPLDGKEHTNNDDAEGQHGDDNRGVLGDCVSPSSPNKRRLTYPGVDSAATRNRNLKSNVSISDL